MKWLHRCARQVLGWVDAWYYRRYQLRTLGPVLYLGHATYRGPRIDFPDGTVLRDNDPIGRLHFNNSSIAALGEGSMHRVGFRFAKLMRESLRQLNDAALNDPDLQRISVFQGVTWIPSHGEVVGFVSTPMPMNWRTRMLTAHFRMLSWVFAPANKIRDRGNTEPRLYWLTRQTLANNVSKLKKEKSAERQWKADTDTNAQLSV
ncbi:MAG: YkoP family protein [Povalibacter sp.]